MHNFDIKRIGNFFFRTYLRGTVLLNERIFFQVFNPVWFDERFYTSSAQVSSASENRHQYATIADKTISEVIFG